MKPVANDGGKGSENGMSNIVVKATARCGRVRFYVGQFGIVTPLRVLLRGTISTAMPERAGDAHF